MSRYISILFLVIAFSFQTNAWANCSMTATENEACKISNGDFIIIADGSDSHCYASYIGDSSVAKSHKEYAGAGVAVDVDNFKKNEIFSFGDLRLTLPKSRADDSKYSDGKTTIQTKLFSKTGKKTKKIADAECKTLNEKEASLAASYKVSDLEKIFPGTNKGKARYETDNISESESTDAR